MGPQRVCPFRSASILNLTSGLVNPLPVWYHDKKHYLRKVSEDPDRFLTDDLDVTRLDKIAGQFIGLRLTSRYKSVARSLHRQLVMDRKVIVTEQADLHLTWDNDGIYIKPLPAYLLDERIWTTYLCKSSNLYESASGFLLSYIWLITHESDFRLAISHESPLLPFGETLTWAMWQEVVEDLSHTINVITREGVNPRYTYGELRLDRLNQIYRYSPAILFSLDHTFIRGYFYRYHNYSTFFEKNFSWLIVVFAYVSIVLSAMQVGLASTQLNSNPAFQHAAYGFTVFAIVLPAALVGIIIVVFILLIISNLLATVGHWIKHNGKPNYSANEHKLSIREPYSIRRE